MFSFLNHLYKEATGVAEKAYSLGEAEIAKFQKYARYCKIVKAVCLVAAVALATLASLFSPLAVFAAGLLGIVVYDIHRMACNAQYIFENAVTFELSNIFTRDINKQIKEKLVENTVIPSCFNVDLFQKV